MNFQIDNTLTPKGSQPEAIKQLVKGLKEKMQFQTLLGVTGSGKSLDYSEIIIVKDSNGKIKKLKIGEFVENELTNPSILEDTEYQESKGHKIISFNLENASISEGDITQVSKHKEDELYEIILDDGSSIKVTKDHNCFKLNNGKLELVKTSELKIGDYLPTSNEMTQPSSFSESTSLLTANPSVKLNVQLLAQKHDSNYNLLAQALKDEKAVNWKVKQIRLGTKERGISINQAESYVTLLQKPILEASQMMKIITKKFDSITPTIQITHQFLRFAGLYVAEGHNAGKYILISNQNKGIQSECKEFWNSLGLNYNIRNKNDIQYASVVIAKFFLQFGRSAYKKRVPNLIYNLSNDQISAFLSGIFDGDGWVEKNSVLLLSASKELIFDVKNLLLRFGITSRVNIKRGKYYKLSVTGRENLLAFKKDIHFTIDYKIAKLSRTIKETSNTNVDLFPKSANLILEIREKFSLKQSDLAKIMKCQRSYVSMIENNKRQVSKNKFSKLAEWLVKKDSKYDYLLNLLKFNFREIKKISKCKSSNGYVYDIAVKNNENFMAGYGNIFVHNTFTMANVIQEVQKPTLVLVHNKTLAAQLYSEFKEFFPNNRVEFFISFYDYYQPESYLPSKDMYIEKDSAINPKIEMMRLSATASLMSRKDVIVIASVSCIYGLGKPTNFETLSFNIDVGQSISRTEFLKKLIAIQYERNDTELMPGRFRVKGDTIDLILGYYNNIIRFEFFGDEVEKIKELDKNTNSTVEEFKHFQIFPAKHFVIPEEAKKKAVIAMQEELDETLPKLGMIEAHRLKQRTLYDIEMIEETGYCKGIENYSRHFDGRKAGEKPYTLMDYFPKDFLLIIDESHQSIPQVHGMFNGDHARKKNLVDYGFRLPCAFDNRPLRFEEFTDYMNQVVFVSATPAEYEIKNSKQVVEQIIRPTGLIDPIVEIRPSEGQVEDLLKEIQRTIKAGNRALVTTLTKKLAEELSDFISARGIKTRYLHSEIDTLERTEIIRELRLGKFDVLVGINLLREGLDIPEVAFIGILDADKEGFLRNDKSLIQIIGRAARNSESNVVLYADRMTDSIKRAVAETTRRRNIQLEYNKKHHITPQTIIKPVKEKEVDISDVKSVPKAEIPNMIIELEAEMEEAADALDFERAIAIRDRVKKLKERERS